MPPIGTEQVIQNSGQVARVQEALQQQMELHRKTLQKEQEKDDEKKLKTVVAGEQKDRVSVHGKDEGEGGRNGEGQDEDEAEDESGDEADAAAKTGGPPDAKDDKKDRTPEPGSRLNVTV